jgi:hypothetical protein
MTRRVCAFFRRKPLYREDFDDESTGRGRGRTDSRHSACGRPLSCTSMAEKGRAVIRYPFSPSALSCRTALARKSKMP